MLNRYLLKFIFVFHLGVTSQSASSFRGRMLRPFAWCCDLMFSSLRHFYLRLGKIFQDWGEFREFRDEKVVQAGIMECWKTGGQ